MTLKNCWKSIPRLWVPKRWSDENITENNLPTKLLVALADLARHGAFNQIRLRAHQTIDHLFGKKSSDESQVSTQPTLDGLVPKQKFMKLWTAEAPTGFTGFKFVPEPHAVEHFRAWPQRDLHDQAFADTIVSEAYQNALNDCVSAFGGFEYGPTISTKTIVGRMRDWQNYSRPAGEIWRAPKDPAETLIGYAAGARPIREKRDCFFRLELCFGATMAEIMLMEKLRPDAYFIPATLLIELDKLVTRFPSIKLATPASVLVVLRRKLFPKRSPSSKEKDVRTLRMLSLVKKAWKWRQLRRRATAMMV